MSTKRLIVEVVLGIALGIVFSIFLFKLNKEECDTLYKVLWLMD